MQKGWMVAYYSYNPRSGRTVTLSSVSSFERDGFCGQPVGGVFVDALRDDMRTPMTAH
ncbi:hypothetical protein ABT275_33250 [Streptomyces sp. NPDC001185]|uniref:hypothetical protein n=1 Tax=Streptomyces sp. NPDC001185 TaxID=3154380 RepID=UPI0033268EA8